MTGKTPDQFTVITDLISSDLIVVYRTSVANALKASVMTKASFDAYISSIGVGAYVSITIPDSTTGTISLGDVTAHTSFVVEYQFKKGNDLAEGRISFMYENSVTKAFPPINHGNFTPKYGNVSPNFFIEQVVISGNELIWKLSNKTGSEVKGIYKIVESKPIIT